MTAKKKRVKKEEDRIPTFANHEEEAAFWDTHDISDYWNELKPAQLKVAKNLSQGITIRFDAETIEELRQQAQRKGIGPTTLVRMWVLERLHGNGPSNHALHE